MFWSTQPATMEKRKRWTKTAAWWTFTELKGREGQQMAIGQWAPPAADENTIPWLLAKTPHSLWTPPPPLEENSGRARGGDAGGSRCTVAHTWLVINGNYSLRLIFSKKKCINSESTRRFVKQVE